VTASVVFGLLHAPGAFLSSASISAVFGVVVLRALTGFLFGIFYEVTQNVYFVALLHGLGNSWPIVINWGNWSGTSLLSFFVAVGILYVGATLLYRHWAATKDLTPTVRRTDSGDQLLALSPE
jgi:membrane protease YdiL (CAAX protease family)